MQCDVERLEWLFRVIMSEHRDRFHHEFEKRGLKEASQPIILFILRDTLGKETISQKDISERIGVSPPTVAVSIKRMEKSGLLRKISDENDLRRNKIVITEKGLKFIKECETTFSDIDHGMYKGFSKSEREQLKSFYERIIKNLENMGAKAPTHLRRSENN